jgi:hypothetical protein
MSPTSYLTAPPRTCILPNAEELSYAPGAASEPLNRTTRQPRKLASDEVEGAAIEQIQDPRIFPASGNPKSLAEERAFSELVYEHDIHVVST